MDLLKKSFEPKSHKKGIHPLKLKKPQFIILPQQNRGHVQIWQRGRAMERRVSPCTRKEDLVVPRGGQEIQRGH
jgi:hypothetical protein